MKFNNLLILYSKQKKRILTNAFSGISSEVIQIISQIFFAPLMLLFWGIESFGIWLFFLSVPNIFLLLNINTLDASVQEITIFKSKGNLKKANEIFQNSISLVFFNILIITTLIIIFYFFYTFELSILKSLENKEIYIIVSLLIASIYINLIEGIFLTGIYSEGKLYIGFNVAGIIDLFSKLSIAFSGIFFNSLVYPALIFFIFAIIKFFINFYYFNTYVKGLFFSFTLISKKIIKRLCKLSIGHAADIISAMIKHSGTTIIIGIFYDPYIVGYLLTVKTLFYFLPVRFFGKLSHITLYEYATLFGEKKYKTIVKNIIGFTKIVLFLLTIFVLVSIIIGPYIYNFWLDNKYDLSITVLLLIIFDALIFILRDSIISILRAINKYILLGISDLILIIITMIVFYLTQHFGYSYTFGLSIILFGTAISFIFAFVILFSFIVKISKKKNS